MTTITDPDGTTSFIITNSHTPDTVSLEGTKVWDDDEDHYGKRPESITVRLFADDVEIDSVTVTEEDGWNWSFTGLDKYRDGGIEIVYTVTEDEVDGYDTDITEEDDGTVTITNTIIPEPKMTKELAEDDYERKDEDIEHDDSNGNFEENIEGDGWGTWDDADNNQEVTYHLILTDIKNATNLTVHDYLEEGLDFEPDTIEIDLYDGGSDTVLTEGSDYTEHEGACTDPNGCAMAGCTFEVEFEDSVFEDISADAYLVITYKALTDTHAGDYDDYEDDILNHSYMTYGIASYRSSIVTTETVLFGFGVYKYADDEGEEIALAGAEFVLERSGVYATFDTETDEDTGEVYYMISGWVEDIDSAGTLTSGSDGMIRIEGLDDDTYTITETKAPVGYEIVDEVITVTIDEDGNVTVNGDTGSKETVIGHVVNVENAPVLTEISGIKTWVGDEESDRPDSITIHLSADGKEIDSRTVKAEDNWEWDFTDLPKYNADGEEIVYTVTEEAVPGYSTDEVAGDAESGFEIINRIVEPQITKEIAEDDYERKEESGSMHEDEDIYGDGWGLWDDADNNQEVTYHLKLTDIKGAVNLTVHDYLEDGLDFEPETIEISLFDPDETELTEGTDYTMTQDACSDTECAMDGCTFEVKFADSVFTDISSDAYLMITYKALTDTHEEDYEDYVDEILNHSYLTYGVNALRRSDIVTTATDLFGFGVYKYADESGTETALAGAEFVLERNGVYATFDIETDADTGEVYYMIYGWVEDIELAAVLTSDADGMIRIEGLDDDTYTITETKAPEGYEIVDEAITVVIDEDGSVTVDGDTGSKEAVVGHVVNVENTPVPEAPVTEVPVEKVWDDSSNVDQLRPASITVKLLADGEDAGEALTLSDSNNWKGTFTDLPVYDADGNEIAYTVEEVNVEGYTTDITGDAGTGYVITNTHTPVPEEATVSVTGGKTWDDEADADGIRPESIIIRVLANGEEVRSAEVTEEDNWEWSFENLPKYDEDGKEIVYTITEDPVDGYDSTVEGYNVTNTHAPETPENPTKSVNVGNGTTVLVGDELTYTITYYNHHSDAETVTIVDMLDTGLEFVSASDNGTYDAATHTVTWVIENAPARTKGKVTVDVKVTEDALTSGSVENDATVQIRNDAAVSTNHVENPVTETGTIPGVKTGDDTPIGTVAAVMAAALALLIAGFAYRRRRVSR